MQHIKTTTLNKLNSSFSPLFFQKSMIFNVVFSTLKLLYFPPADQFTENNIVSCDAESRARAQVTHGS